MTIPASVTIPDLPAAGTLTGNELFEAVQASPITGVQKSVQTSLTQILAHGAGGSPGGLNTEIQFNDANNFNGIVNAPPGNALISGASGHPPLFGKIGLASHVSGNLPTINLNSGSGADATTFWRGDGQWATAGAVPTFSTVNNYGTDYEIIDPTLGDRPGDPNGNTYCAAIRLFIQDDANLDVVPTFSALDGLYINIVHRYGDNNYAPNGFVPPWAVAKLSVLPLLMNGDYYGAGQKFMIDRTLNGWGMGDTFLQSDVLEYYCGPVAGDEGVGYASVSHVRQAQSHIIANVTSVTRTSFNTTLTQIVNGNKNPQTVTVASTAGANIGDWIVVNQSVDTGADVIEATQITAVGAGTITAAFRFNYPSGCTLTPALVLGTNASRGFGQQRVLVNLSAAATYSVGQIASSSGADLIGSGTTWSNGMVGGDALNVGAIALAKDDYSGFPYNVPNPLKSWYQITAVNSATDLSIHSFSVAGGTAYHGAGSFPSNYIIRPAARILRLDTGVMVCETSTHTWLVNDIVECVACPYPDVTGFQQRIGGYTPGGSYRAFFDIENDGGRTFELGLGFVGAPGLGWGPGRTDGGDRYAWGSAIHISEAQIGMTVVGTSDPVTPTGGSTTDPVGILLSSNFAKALTMQNAGTIGPNYDLAGVDFFLSGNTTAQFKWGINTNAPFNNLVGLVLSTGGVPITSVPEAALDIDIQTGTYPGILVRVNNGHNVDLLTFKDHATSLGGVDQNTIFYAPAVRLIAGTFGSVTGANVEGTLVAITDSTTKTLQATITGSGGFHVLGYYNGTNWIVAAAAP